MTLVDVTLALGPETPVFPGDPPFRARPHSRVEDGGGYNLSELCLGSHTGTHVDAPRHYLRQGATVDQLPLEALVGPAVVADMGRARRIDEPALRAAGLEGARRVLLRTMGGPALERGHGEPVCGLTPGAARLLVSWGVALVGIDQLSVEDHAEGDSPVHLILLGAGVVIVEALRLSRAQAGPCRVMCLPLAWRGGDGAPARVVLDYD